MWIKRTVVMLPTNEKANHVLGFQKRVHKQLSFNKSTKFIFENPQHIYILSDEPIKEGDWAIHKNDQYRKDFPFGKDILIRCNKSNKESIQEHWRKIIATTDKSLIMKQDIVGGFMSDIAFPQPSQAFIEKYVEEYNKGNIITEIMVEYEEIVGEEPFRTHFGYKLKINPKDNTITIRKVKDSWTRKELEDILVKHYAEIASSEGCNLGEDVRKWTKSWINKNL